ncbi:MAG: hypothetical protein H7101_11145 [Deinococcales bacterium]|nr:hypothetical protein [Chitinophagaceae bacterium]
MKSLITITIFCLFATIATAQKLTPNNLKVLEGAWVGTLTYLDYVSGKPFTMPANTTYQQSANNPNIYLRSIGYSTEPHANQKDSMIISCDGTMLDDYKIISKKQLANGILEIVSEKKGIDGNDNKPALMRRIFTITNNTFTNKKEVLFDGSDKWLLRHTYSFTKQ